MFSKVNKKSFEIKVILLISLLYTIAFGLILFNKGLFFDDWVHFNQSFSTRLNEFKESGVLLYLPAYLYTFTFGKSIIFGRILIFFSFLLSAFLLYLILKKIKEIDSNSRLFIILFFTLFPLNFARIAWCTFFYSFCYLLFYLGFWLISVYLERKLLFIRILALVILFFSLTTNSLLVFYAVPILYIFYYEKNNTKGFLSLIKKMLKYADFILLPIFFWIIDNFFFKPYGMYTTYNKIGLNDIFLFPKFSVIAFKNCFIYIIDKSSKILYSYTFIIIATSLILFLFLKYLYMYYKENQRKDLWLLFFGVIAFLIAVLPYFVVGKMPDSFKSISRHQLLFPLGLSFILYYGLKIFFNLLRINHRIKFFIYSLIIVFFIATNFFAYLEFQKDYFKQISMIENIESSEIIKNNTTFLFKDNTLDLNAQQRDIGFDEYNGMMKLVFKDETRFGVDDTFGYNSPAYLQEYINRPQYNFSEYKPKFPDYTVIIDYGKYHLSTKNTFLLIYNDLFDKQRFEEDIKNILSLSYDKL